MYLDLLLPGNIMPDCKTMSSSSSSSLLSSSYAAAWYDWWCHKTLCNNSDNIYCTRSLIHGTNNSWISSKAKIYSFIFTKLTRWLLEVKYWSDGKIYNSISISPKFVKSIKYFPVNKRVRVLPNQRCKRLYMDKKLLIVLIISQPHVQFIILIKLWRGKGGYLLH